MRLARVPVLAITLTHFVTACATSDDVGTGPRPVPGSSTDERATSEGETTASQTPNAPPASGSPSDPSKGAPAGETTTPGDSSAAPSPTTDPSTVAPASPIALRGTNLVGMEGGYNFDTQRGPTPDVEYAVHSNRIIDYLSSKNVNVIRFLFSWERMQSTLGGPVPAAETGNYKAYFDDYKRIVDYATSKGMTVVMAPWQSGTSGTGGARWRGNLVGGSVVTSEHFADFWTKMATHFADNPRVAINLINEPHTMSTMAWFGIAQDAITAIRTAGFKGEIFVPGNGWTGAAGWNNAGYDTGSPQRSNAYGWLNARGPGLALEDPLRKLVIDVHSYADSNASGGSTQVLSATATRSRVQGVVDWARANGLKVWIGEVGMYANAANAGANWSDFVSFADASTDTLVGFAWWACGKPGWWNDVAANGGGHFSITPTNDYTTDTVNMTMIQSAMSR